MIWGANMTLVHRAMAKKVKSTQKELASFCVRWAMRGLQIPEKEIETALRAAERCVARNRAIRG
jgi:hypothetical protein